MARSIDWMKQNTAELVNQSMATKAYLIGNLGKFGIDGVSAQWVNDNFSKLHVRFAGNYNICKDPNTCTPAKTAALKETKKEFIAAYRQLYKAFLKDNPNVTDEDLVAMELPPRSTSKPTPTPVPTTVPVAEVKLPSQGVVEINFRDSGTNRRAKPAGVHGAEIVWAILDTPPADWSELTNSVFDTKTPYEFRFSGTERGKKLFFALRWENTRGEKGRWSDIYEAIVP